MRTICTVCLQFILVSLAGQGISNSGYITISGSPYIIINNGSLVNSGTWTKATEAVSFEGTTASELKGTSTSYHNLVVSNTGGITLNTPNVITCDNLTINASGIFTIAPTSKLTVSSTLANSNGNSGLVVKSTVDGTGSLISTSAVSATVEQFHTDSTYIYHMVTMPVSSGTAAAYKFNGVQTYMYGYNPATPAWDNIKTSATALNVGQGYLVNYHNVAVDRTSTFTGTLNANNISPVLSATTDKFNLVGNPYPCAIDWNAVSGWTKSNISGTYYLWLPAKGTYGTYTTSGNISVNGLGNIIQAGQGFFVFSTAGSPVLSVANAAKTHNNSRLKSAAVSPTLLKLHISNDANTTSDEAVVLFSTEGSDVYDPAMDALKMQTLTSTASQIYTAKLDKKLVIKALSANFKDSIPLYFKCNTAATYTIELANNTYSDSIVLTDLISGTTELISAGKYTFTALKTDTVRRFVLNRKKTESPGTGADGSSGSGTGGSSGSGTDGSSGTGTEISVNREVTGVSIYSDGKRAYLVNNTKQDLDGNLTINDMSGKILIQKNIYLTTEYSIDISYPGVYIVSFSSGKQWYRGKVVIFE